VRRLLPVLAGVLLLVGGIYLVMTVASGRETGGGVAGDEQAAGPGELEPVAEGRPTADGDPPTSGDHADRNLTAEGRVDVDELLTALEQGNVVLAYPPGPRPPALVRLQEAVSGPFDPELAAAGQMVVLVPWPGIDAVQGLAYRRRLRASGPQDDRLRAFAEAWLGQGLGHTG
jgi:Protein of unknown function (DUF3105)